MAKTVDNPVVETPATPAPVEVYSFPELGVSVEASSMEEALKLAEKKVNG